MYIYSCMGISPALPGNILILTGSPFVMGMPAMKKVVSGWEFVFCKQSPTNN